MTDFDDNNIKYYLNKIITKKSQFYLYNLKFRKLNVYNLFEYYIIKLINFFIGNQLK